MYARICIWMDEGDESISACHLLTLLTLTSLSLLWEQPMMLAGCRDVGGATWLFPGLLEAFDSLRDFCGPRALMTSGEPDFLRLFWPRRPGCPTLQEKQQATRGRAAKFCCVLKPFDTKHVDLLDASRSEEHAPGERPFTQHLKRMSSFGRVDGWGVV